MTTTKALAKLYKVIVGSEGRNSAAKILSDLADNWSSAGMANAAKIPTMPTTDGDYFVTVEHEGSAVVYSWSKDEDPKVPVLPHTGDTATYVLKATKDGDKYTYSWVAES